MDTALGKAFFGISVYRVAAEEGLTAAHTKMLQKERWEERWNDRNYIAARSKLEVDDLSTADLNFLKRAMDVRLAAATNAADPTPNYVATNKEIDTYKASAERRMSAALTRIETYRTTTMTPWREKGKAPALKKLKTLALREAKRSVQAKGKPMLNSMVNTTMNSPHSPSSPLPLPPKPPKPTVITPPSSPFGPPLFHAPPSQPQPRLDFPTPSQSADGEEGVRTIPNELDEDMALFPAVPQAAACADQLEITSTGPNTNIDMMDLDDPMDETQHVDTVLGNIRALDGTDIEFSENPSPSQATEDINVVLQRIRDCIAPKRSEMGPEDVEVVRQRVCDRLERRCTEMGQTNEDIEVVLQRVHARVQQRLMKSV
jgi:hypothetical protein